ncbi:YvrJ family protein [Alkalibacillus silvisoli]|uniref:YvrJ family protein n=1 Tax=Alkalibacillus silvisoli TaxID=392823 RepID=A0ABN0ZMU8_9BACI
MGHPFLRLETQELERERWLKIVMEAWVNWVPDVGFPILVTFYLLHRIEKKLEQLNKSIMKIPSLIEQ